MKAFKYKLSEQKEYKTDIIGQSYSCKNPDHPCEIFPDGKLLVYRGFLSDGNSPKFNTWFGPYGIPDGPFDHEKGEPITAPAFYKHDALIHLNREGQLNIEYKWIHAEYCHEIEKTNYRFRWFYCQVVKLLGPKK